MDLKRNAKGYENDDGSFGDGGGDGGRVHAYDITLDVVAKGKIASNCYEDVD